MQDIFNDDQDFELGQDLIEEFRNELPAGRIATIRTSDRNNFRRCRRRWNWQSHLRHNLGKREAASPLWYGTGFHFALEDFHGYQRYASPVLAFEAYVKATYAQSRQDHRYSLPTDWPELVVLGRGMLSYYADTWLNARDPLKTFWVDGVPQVEVHALAPIPHEAEGYEAVYYGVTIDRVVIDEEGRLWLVDYKTAKRIQTQFFQTDPQISSYMWIASQIYPNHEIAGFYYQQHRKDVPEDPRVVGSGRISTASGLKTTHRHYRKALLNLYGDVMKAPIANVDYLNWLNEIETSERDLFIRRDRVRRNKYQIEAEGTKILMEVADMLNPNLPLYPNPTRECGHLCDFNGACVSMDDGGDWEADLRSEFTTRADAFESWRKFLPPIEPAPSEQFVSMH